MQTTRETVTRMYAAFNRRDIDATLAFMTEDVDWPKASEGGRVIGKEDIRAYWTRQWKEFDPHVEPAEIDVTGPDRASVKVHQVVRSLSGEGLFDGMVWHVFTFANGLVQRMDIHETGPGWRPSHQPL